MVYQTPPFGEPMIPDPSDREAFIKWSLAANEAATERWIEWQEEIGRPVPKRWSKKRLRAMKPPPGAIDLDDAEEG